MTMTLIAYLDSSEITETKKHILTVSKKRKEMTMTLIVYNYHIDSI